MLLITRYFAFMVLLFAGAVFAKVTPTYQKPDLFSFERLLNNDSETNINEILTRLFGQEIPVDGNGALDVDVVDDGDESDYLDGDEESDDFEDETNSVADYEETNEATTVESEPFMNDEATSDEWEDEEHSASLPITPDMPSVPGLLRSYSRNQVSLSPLERESLGLLLRATSAHVEQPEAHLRISILDLEHQCEEEAIEI